MKRLTPALAALAAALTLAGAADAVNIPTSEQVEQQFTRTQECRRSLGQHVYQTSHDWRYAKRGPYYLWMHDLWKQRADRCEKQRARANRDVRYAIRLIFQGPGDPRYPYDAAEQAVRVAWCESRWTTWNVTGQYAGVGQLGTSERADYGLGPYRSSDTDTAITADAVTQVRSFYRMFVAAGRSWARWACRPGSGGETSSWVAY